MTRGGGMMVLVLVSFVSGLGTPVLLADMAGNPYQGIVERNVFNLRTRLAEPVEPPAAPPPKITLTGFTDILGNKRVLFKVQIPAKPPAPAKEESCILAEGEREGDIEALEIDEIAGVAKFKNHGTIQTLNLANDGAKPSPVPQPTASPGMPVRPQVVPGLSGLPPNPAAQSMPPRTLRRPGMPGGQSPQTIPGYPGPSPPNTPPSPLP